MKVYVLVSSPYHENDKIIGVFASIELAKSSLALKGFSGTMILKTPAYRYGSSRK